MIHAPYGFVPLNDRVFTPEWAPAASQDWPFRDGLSGTLELEIEALTPIFVRGGKTADAFFRGPEGLPAIPGSSLRGAIRNVVEIASWGWMRRVNDHRYGVRDLQNQALYVQHMAGIMPSLVGKQLPLPKVVAGWLRKTSDYDVVGGNSSDVVATLEPCDFAKVDYRYVIDEARKKGVGEYRPGDRQSAVDKYRTWKFRPDQGGDDWRLHDKMKVTVDVEELRERKPDWLNRGFGRVRAMGRGKAGTLVFTGQPSRWSPSDAPRPGGGHAKHHDFVFFASGAPTLNVKRSVMEGFEFVHGGGQEQHSLNKRRSRNDEWGFWGEAFDKGLPIPVFFLPALPKPNSADPVTVRALGLAMMFRLAYTNTTLDAVRAAQANLGKDPRPDLAETLFGHVPLARKGAGAEREAALKGRVSFGLARVSAGGAALAPVTAVLGAPKASYYPAYVEQDPTLPGSPPRRDGYRTFMDADARVRGHKRYRPQTVPTKGVALPVNGKGEVNTRVGTTFRPVEAGTKFTSTLRVHNVRPTELGALLWALDFGGDPECSHTFGMARSLGYGRASMRVVRHQLVPNDPGVQVDTSDAVLNHARAAFADTMNAFCTKADVDGAWEYSRRLFELRELAKVLPDESPHRAHMRIDGVDLRQPNRKVNGFIEGKRAGEVLPAAGTVDAWRARAARNGVTLRTRVPAAPVPTSPSQPGGYGGPASGPAGRGAPPVVAPPVVGGGWVPLKGGTAVEVELLGLNKKGKWQVKLVGKEAQGLEATGVCDGTPPADATSGMKASAIIVAGGDRRNLGLKWG